MVTFRSRIERAPCVRPLRWVENTDGEKRIAARFVQTTGNRPDSYAPEDEVLARIETN